METWVALFRGINVGGKNKLPMADLRKMLEALQLTNVRTYIQSGNVVFEADRKVVSSLNAKIAKRMEKDFGFCTPLIILGREDVYAAIESNPYPDAESDPKSLHLFFLATLPTDPDVDSIVHAKANGEQFQLTDNVFYLWAPNGIGRSKLAANVEKYLRVAVTARNYRTVQKLMAMATDS